MLSLHGSIASGYLGKDRTFLQEISLTNQYQKEKFSFILQGSCDCRVKKTFDFTGAISNCKIEEINESENDIDLKTLMISDSRSAGKPLATWEREEISLYRNPPVK